MDISSIKPVVVTEKLEANNVKQHFTLSGKPLRDMDGKVIEDDDDEPEESTPEKQPHDSELIVQEFRISPLIRDIEDFLIGPPQRNMQNAEYATLIPMLTNTECFRNQRCLVISGEKSYVEDALQRFKVLETLYVRSSNEINQALHLLTNDLFRLLILE